MFVTDGQKGRYLDFGNGRVRPLFLADRTFFGLVHLFAGQNLLDFVAGQRFIFHQGLSQSFPLLVLLFKQFLRALIAFGNQTLDFGINQPRGVCLLYTSPSPRDA